MANDPRADALAAYDAAMQLKKQAFDMDREADGALQLAQKALQDNMLSDEVWVFGGYAMYKTVTGHLVRARAVVLDGDV